MKLKEILQLKESELQIVSMNVPFFIRCLEWALEECQDDVELHKFVEKLLQQKQPFDMSSYQEITR